MAKKISLQLEINGVKTSVSSINDLETAIKDANTELKGLEIGSEAFKKLSGDIKKAKDLSEDLQESLKGQDLEKRVGSYAKVGSAIVSSFAAAQASLALFGQENEDVAQAAAKAQAVLTIALTAREVAEGAVAIKTVAANIATYASAAAAGAATTATRILWATLAANPIGAILVTVGALVAAFVALGNAGKEQVNVSKELTQATSAEADKLKTQLFILTQMTNARNLQQKTLEELKKEYPGFNAFIDKENRLTQQGVEFIKLKIRQYELEAQAKLVTQKIAENGIKLLGIENEQLSESVGFWQETWEIIKLGGSVAFSAFQGFQTKAQKHTKEVEKITKENDLWRNSLVKIYQESDKVIGQLKPYEQALTTQVAAEKRSNEAKDEAAKRQEQLNEAYKKGKTSSIDLSKAIDELNKVFKQYEQTIKNLETVKYDAPILEQLKNIREARVSAAKELVDGLEEVRDSLNQLGTVLPEDVLIDYFVELRGMLEDEFTKVGTDAFVGFEQVYKVFVEQLNKQGKKLSAEQSQILGQLVSGYKDLGQFLSSTEGFTKYINSLTGINVAWDDFRKGGEAAYDTGTAFMMIIGELTAANKTFIDEFKGGSETARLALQANIPPPIEPLQFDIAKVQANSRKYITELERALFRPVAERLVQQELEIQQKLLKTTTDATAKKEIEGRIDTLLKQVESIRTGGKLIAEFSQTTTAQVETEVSKIVQQFINLSNAVVGAEQRILSVNKEVNRLTTELSNSPEQLSKAIGGVLLRNIGAISDLLIGIRTKEQKAEQAFVESVKNDRQGLEDFKKRLIKEGIDVEKASYEDLLKAYIEYKKKEKDVTKQSEADKRSESEKTFQEINKYIQVFSQGLNQAASLSNESIQTQLDFLQMSYEKQLAQIVGDTESANAKRLELQTKYEEERKAIEKQGRLSALRFSLAQAVANSAQAITAIWATQGINPILAGIQTALVAGITAAEISIINEQINMTQMMRRGGLLKAQGGMLLSGPSHEQGGIPLAQMGIIAEGQESIINRNSTINYRDLLSSINQAGGGRPLVMNSFDDTRIVEAIASQRQKPLRAYVLQSEITNEQALSKRLDDLSKI